MLFKCCYLSTRKCLTAKCEPIFSLSLFPTLYHSFVHSLLSMGEFFVKIAANALLTIEAQFREREKNCMARPPRCAGAESE